MSSIRTVSLEYGDTRFSIYLIDLPSECAKAAPGITQVMHSHFYYEIHYAARGQCLYRFSDREVFLPEGYMLIIPPGANHAAVDLHSKSYTPRVLSLSLTATENSGKFHSAFLSCSAPWH